MNFDTKLIQIGNNLNDKNHAIGTPIYLNTTFEIEELGKDQEYEYSRVSNPTRKVLEELIATLENGTSGFAFSSGLAAINAVFSIFSSGDHIVIGNDIYGGTYRIIHKIIKNFGITFTFVDTRDIQQIHSALQENTKAIFIETPSNPLLQVTDIKAIVELVRGRNIITIADNTFLSPYWQKPLDLGVDITLHSATKFLGGHSDIIAGLVVVKDDILADKLALSQKALGGILSPFDSWLLIRSIRTLKVRLDLQQENTLRIISYLASHPNIEKIYYPGYKNNKEKQIQLSQSTGTGSVFSFKTKTDKQTYDFLHKVKLATFAVSLGGVETLVSHPFTMSHSGTPSEEKEKNGITNNLIRVSIGIENYQDIIEDFEQALK